MKAPPPPHLTEMYNQIKVATFVPSFTILPRKFRSAKANPGIGKFKNLRQLIKSGFNKVLIFLFVILTAAMNLNNT